MDRIARASWNFCPKNETEQAANGNRSTKCICHNGCNQSTHKQHGLNTHYWTRLILKGVGTKMSKQLSKCYTCSFLIGWMNKQYKNRVVSAKEGTSKEQQLIIFHQSMNGWFELMRVVIQVNEGQNATIDAPYSFHNCIIRFNCSAMQKHK